MEKNNRRWMILVSVICCYFVFGYFDSGRGATLSELMTQRGLSYGMGGTLAFLYYLGYFFSTLLGGMISDTIPKKKFLAFGSSLLLLATIGYITVDWLLYPAVFVIGIVLGIYEVAGNGAIVEAYPPAQRGRYLNIIAGTHSVGAVLAPLLYSVFIANGKSWTTVFFSIIPIICLSVILLLIAKVPATTYSEPSSFTKKSFFDALKTKKLNKFYWVGFFYLAAEATVISWMVSFLTETRMVDINTASMMVSMFFLLIGIGRFMGGTVLAKIPVHKLLQIGFPFACVTILLGIMVKGLFWMLPLAGLFMSFLFPMTLTEMSNTSTENTGASLGIYFAFASAGATIGSWLSGQVIQISNTQVGLLCAVIFLAAAILMLNIREKSPKEDAK